jgi:antitoxin component of RelBE/YafQ-DinJ toxin-antitoxin module
MSLSSSNAIWLLLARMAAEKALPVKVKVQNAETRAAMTELKCGAGLACAAWPN